MARVTGYSSEDSVIFRDLTFQSTVLYREDLKLAINSRKQYIIASNTAFNQKLIKLCCAKLRRNICNGFFFNVIGRHVLDKSMQMQIRTEYYNDIDLCSEILLPNNLTWELNSYQKPSMLFYQGKQSCAKTEQSELLSYHEPVLCSDAMGNSIECVKPGYNYIYNTVTKSSNRKLSLGEEIMTHIVPLDYKHYKLNRKRITMTVMTLDSPDSFYENDWGKEREVVLTREDAKSFGISIVGGTVNVPQDITVSGIFIKTIIPNSPAEKCGLLKIGDRILMVDGTDIRYSTHEHAMNIIKNADRKISLLVQSLIKKIDNCIETRDLLRNVPPPITPCKTPESEVIHDIHDKGNDKFSKDANTIGDAMIDTNSTNHFEAESENSSDDEDERDLEGKTYTTAGVEIDRASAGNIKWNKDESLLDAEQEDCFGYTTKKIRKRYGGMDQIICHTIERSSGSSLGISLAGHRDRTKMACFIAGVNPQGLASSFPFQVGDEILEVNGIVLQGRSHLNVPSIIKGIEGSSLKFIVSRNKQRNADLAVRPVTQFPTYAEEEDEIFSVYKNVRLVPIKKPPAGLGIMIIEGKHSEVGRGIFVSDIQEGSMADQAGLNIGEMILAVNRDSLLGCTYETAAILLKRAEGVVTLKICNPNKKESNEAINTFAKSTSKNITIDKSSTATDSSFTKGDKPVTLKSTPANDMMDPSKAEIIENENTVIEINAANNPLGIVAVGGCDSLISFLLVDPVVLLAADRMEVETICESVVLIPFGQRVYLPENRIFDTAK
ncbi:inactivation-no-after-potential D protein [Malaya genurostris]|uniref:inactivation-no-after-potential D protein n=1 Tax=Malaya genurostris TaxID=325434 RepID=UPI0026F3F9EA|nr:inactivation-no-after-potential D protein [Malaya genurostris]